MTTDKRIAQHTKDLNHRQQTLFIQHAEMIERRGWRWRKAANGNYQVLNSDNEPLGEGVTIIHAFQEAESAK